jgi:hypothetical protein
MGEYAVVVSTVAAVLIVALGGLGRSLPATTAGAASAVAKAARGAGVDAAAARKAVAGAPYGRPQLRTLYGLGWVAGTKDRATCLVATATGLPTERQAREALRRVKNWQTVLRRSRVTKTAAVRAIDRGFRSACPT